MTIAINDPYFESRIERLRRRRGDNTNAKTLREIAIERLTQLEEREDDDADLGVSARSSRSGDGNGSSSSTDSAEEVGSKAGQKPAGSSGGLQPQAA